MDGWRAKAEQVGEQLRTIRQASALFIHHLDLITFKYNDVNELARVLSAPILDDQKSGFDDLKHKA